MKKENFYNKIKNKRKVEREILKWFRTIDSTANIPTLHNKNYNITSQSGTIKVIEDLHSNHTGYFKIKPPKADFCVLVNWDSVYFLRSEDIKRNIKIKELPPISKIIPRWFSI